MIDGFQDEGIPARLRDLGFQLYDGRTMQPYQRLQHPALLAIALPAFGGAP